MTRNSVSAGQPRPVVATFRRPTWTRPAMTTPTSFAEPVPDGADPPPTVPYTDALRVWALIGLYSFGGPAGQIAVMHRMLVEDKKWIGERRFLHALNYCMMLPGPEATQLATYVGWLLHGRLGGLTAGILFILPGFISLLALSLVFVTWGDVALVRAGLSGLAAAVVAIVIEALIRIGRKTLRRRSSLAIAASAFVGIFIFGVPFPAIVAAAIVVGLLVAWVKPTKVGDVQDIEGEAAPLGADARAIAAMPARMLALRSVRTLVVWLTIWWAPVALLAAFLGSDTVFVREGIFFSKTAVVTFGGAYAVLAYVAQQAVEVYQWVSPQEMIQGLALAETTPGPLIMVLQFVGFLGGYRDPGVFSPISGGILAAIITTWVTFVPCFLWIFLGAPYFERMSGNRHIVGAFSAVTAAVVGVILNLALWFAVHAIFDRVETARWGLMRMPVPDASSVDVPTALIASAAIVMVFALRWRMLTVLGACLMLALGLEVAGIVTRAA